MSEQQGGAPPRCGQRWKDRKTGEVVTLVARKESTIVLYQCESEWGDSPDRTRCFGETDGPRRFDLVSQPTSPNTRETT